MKTKMGIGTPWSAPALTRAQRACLARHGIVVSTRAAMDSEGHLWEPARGGGRDSVRVDAMARNSARAGWNR